MDFRPLELILFTICCLNLYFNKQKICNCKYFIMKYNLNRHKIKQKLRTTEFIFIMRSYKTSHEYGPHFKCQIFWRYISSKQWKAYLLIQFGRY